MQKIGLSVFFCMLLLSGTMHAQQLEVPSQYSTIQSAINAAQNGDTVLVSRGRYFENINYNGKAITVASRFIITRNPEDIKFTIIDGSQPTVPDSASCVRIYRPQSSIQDTSAALIGFSITGGRGTVWADEHNPESFYREGGGILIQYMSPRILYNIIYQNEAYVKTGIASAGGGAIRCGDGNPVISNNIINNNKARYGAGIVLNYSGAQIHNNIIANNYGGEDYGGSGIWINGRPVAPQMISNNTIVRNRSKKPGGGFYIYAATLTAKNNIIWGNTASVGPQIYNEGNASFTYCDIQNGFTGTGNINIDPKFADSTFILSVDSPCVDAGDTSSVYNDIPSGAGSQLAAPPSLGTIRNDLGAFGGKRVFSLSYTVSDVEVNQAPELESDFRIFGNYPNPFNPSTTISYYLPKTSRLKIQYYSILGDLLSEVDQGEQSAGYHTIGFSVGKDAGLTASGIYLAVLTNGEHRKTLKMTLLK